MKAFTIGYAEDDKKVTQKKRITGIEPASPAWEAGVLNCRVYLVSYSAVYAVY